jgi:hypothetical protein
MINPLISLPFLNHEAARKEIRNDLMSNRIAYWVWSMLENNDIPSNELELYVSTRLPLGYTREEIMSAISVATKAYNFLNVERHQARIDAYNEDARKYYEKYGTQGEF